MFDNILGQLRDLEQGREISVDVSIDDDGYYDRRCPSATCNADFKIFFDDWKDVVRDEQAFCPICREEAQSGEWDTPEQSEYFEQVAVNYFEGIIGDALQRDARDFNRGQRPGFIQMSMSYEPGARPLTIPVNAAEELRQKFTCELCQCRYSSLGAAFFCPACGHNSAESMFSQTVEAVRKSLAALAKIREAVSAESDPDAAENTVREIVENNLVRLVGAFQRIAEVLFSQRLGGASATLPRNVFQNLTEGSAAWKNETEMGYEDLLSAPELAQMRCLFQQRHLLAHCEGIADPDYILKSGDTNYAVGQRIVVREAAVIRLCDLVSSLKGKLSMLV